MAKVIDCFHVGKYAIVVADYVPARYSKVKIGGKEYSVTIAYDIPKAVAVESTIDFKDFEIEFIM